jgi:hypothetical protein
VIFAYAITGELTLRLLMTYLVLLVFGLAFFVPFMRARERAIARRWGLPDKQKDSTKNSPD